MKAALKKSIVKNSFWSFWTSFVNRVGALVFTIILTRFLLPEGFGIYSIVLSIAMIFYTFTELGTNNALKRYVSYALSRERKKVYSYYSYLLRIKLTLAFITSCFVFLLAYPISYYIFKNTALFVPLLVSSLYIFIMAIESFYASIFYSIEKTEFTTLRYALEQILRIGFAVGIFIFVASSSQVAGLFITFTLVSSILLFMNLFYLKKLSPIIFIKNSAEIDKRRIRKFINFLIIASVSGVFFTYVDSILLGFFLEPQYVGYYRAAYSLVLGVAGILSFSTPVLLPFFTKINKKGVKFLFNESFRLLSIILVPSVFGLIILGRFFVRMFFGYPFLPSVVSLHILSFLVFPVVFINMFLSLFSAKEKTNISAKLIICTSVLNVVLNLVFILLFLRISPIFATVGAALATTISWFFYFIGFVYESKRNMGITVPFKSLSKPFFSSIIMSIFLIIATSLIKDMNLFLGIFVVLAAAAVYLIVLIMLKGITIKDLNLLKILVSNEKTR